MLHEAVQTYNVEIPCEHSIYCVSVTNNHLRLEIQALHIAMWLKLNIITQCTVGV